MSTEDNKALVRRLVEEGWNQGQLDLAEAILHPEYHSSLSEAEFWRAGGSGTRSKGRGALDIEIQTYQRVFSELHFTIEDILAQGDTVVVMGSATGTFRHRTTTTRVGAEIPALLGTKWVHVVRVEDGKIKSSEQYRPGDITE